jgi:hypothetical protein
MPPLITYGLILSFGLAAIVGTIDGLLGRKRKSVLLFAGLLGAFITLYLTTGFPSSDAAKAFGTSGFSPMLAMLLMFIAVLFGIGGTYIFHLTGPFSWRDFARPLVISPLVLLPLIGSLQGAALEPVQLICFLILAFQNGFFWQQVLTDAKPTTR